MRNMLNYSSMTKTPWLDANGMRGAWAKTTDINGRHAVALEVRSRPGQGDLLRLLFEIPDDREPFAMLDFDYGTPMLPAYVWVE